MDRTRLFLVLLAAGAALLGAVLLFRGRETERPRTPPGSDESSAPPDRAVPDRRNPPPRNAPDRAHLRRELEKLGRAVVFRDRASIEKIRLEFPQLYESDIDWIVAQLKGDLFAAAGAAELARIFGLKEAVPALGELLRSGAHVCAKDAAVDALAGIGGEGALAVLLETLQGTADGSVRARAAKALVSFQGPEVYHALVQVLRGEKDAAVRRAAAEALRKLPSQDAVDVLMAALRAEPDAGTRVEIAIAAYAAGGRDVLPALRRELGPAEELLNERLKRNDVSRYGRPYDAAFFRNGRPLVPITGTQRTIGITLEPGSTGVRDIASEIFRASPLDRYRAFFRLRVAGELEEDLLSGLTPRAYDAEGVSIPGGIPLDDMDGRVFIRWVDPKTLPSGVLGYSEGRDAFVTRVSLLHEFGHAFASLGDEYAKSVTAGPAWNLEPAPRAPAWQPLSGAGHLPKEPVPREEPSGEPKWFVPSGSCFMNNNPADDRYCPVCQLELIARICELSGCPLPW